MLNLKSVICEKMLHEEFNFCFTGLNFGYNLSEIQLSLLFVRTFNCKNFREAAFTEWVQLFLPKSDDMSQIELVWYIYRDVYSKNRTKSLNYPEIRAKNIRIIEVYIHT